MVHFVYIYIKYELMKGTLTVVYLFNKSAINLLLILVLSIYLSHKSVKIMDSLPSIGREIYFANASLEAVFSTVSDGATNLKKTTTH